MIDSPEARPLVGLPWLFSRRSLALVLLVGALAATFRAADLAFLAGCLVLVGLVARGWATVVFSRVRYRRRPATRRAFFGDQLVLESVLENPRPLPLPWVEVWERLPRALDPEGSREPSFDQPGAVWVQRALSLWPYQRLRWQRRLTCRQRGVFELGEVRLRSGDPFGLVEREQLVADQHQLLIYPRVVPLRFLDLPTRQPAPDLASPRSTVTDPTRTAALRDYQPGDPQRLIHWPTTARRGQLQVRVLEPATALHCTLALDVRGFTFGGHSEELLELTISALASIAVYLQTHGSPTALVANTREPLVIPAGASVEHLEHLLEALARLDPVPGPVTEGWLWSHTIRPATVVLAASEMCPELSAMLRRLQVASVPVVLLYAAVHHGSPVAGPLRTFWITPGCAIEAVLEGRA